MQDDFQPDHGEGFADVFRNRITGQRSTDGEHACGQGNARHQLKGVVRRAGNGQGRRVIREAQGDRDHERIAGERTGDLTHCSDRAGTIARAHFHTDNAKGVHRRGMDRDNSKDRRVRPFTKCALGDWNADEQRVREEGRKSGGDRFARPVAEQPSRDEHANEKACEGRQVVRCQHIGLERVCDVDGRCRPKQQACDRKIGHETHQPIHRCVGKQLAGRGRVAQPDQQKDWRDDVENLDHEASSEGWTAPIIVPPSAARKNIPRNNISFLAI